MATNRNSKGQFSASLTPQLWYDPAEDKEYKVEWISTTVRVVHFPTGPERFKFNDMKKQGWVHRGPAKIEGV